MNSLRRQLTRELILVLALLLGAGLLAIYGVMWKQLNRAFNAALEARALGISALVEQENGRVQVDFSEKLLRGFNVEKARRYFELRDIHGALIARSPSLQANRMNPPPGPATQTAVYWDLELPNGRDGRAVRFLFRPKSASEHAADVPVAAELMVAVDREDLDETLGWLFAAVAGCGVLLLGAVLFVVPRVLRHGLAPVNRLGDQAARIDAGSLAERFPVGELPAELQSIGGRLNDLLSRLETSFERERRFSADLATSSGRHWPSCAASPSARSSGPRPATPPPTATRSPSRCRWRRWSRGCSLWRGANAGSWPSSQNHWTSPPWSRGPGGRSACGPRRGRSGWICPFRPAA